MRYAIIESGIVINTAVAEEPLADNWLADPSDTCAIGDTWDGSAFVRPPVPEPEPVVPETVTMRAARRALLDAGLLSKVGQAIASMPSPDRERAMIDWEYAQTVERHSPFVASLAPVLGLSDTDLDTLFTVAATMPP